MATKPKKLRPADGMSPKKLSLPVPVSAKPKGSSGQLADTPFDSGNMSVEQDGGVMTIRVKTDTVLYETEKGTMMLATSHGFSHHTTPTGRVKLNLNLGVA